MRTLVNRKPRPGWRPRHTTRSQFYRDLRVGPFYGYNRPGANASEAVIQNWWWKCMMGPSDVFAIRLEDIHWAKRRIWIPTGKTDRARRFVGISERMHLGLATWCHGDAGPGSSLPAARPVIFCPSRAASKPRAIARSSTRPVLCPPYLRSLEVNVARGHQEHGTVPTLEDRAVGHCDQSAQCRPRGTFRSWSH
jgi:hypothetical protein